MELELVQYVYRLRRWLWLIVLAAFLGGGFAFVVASTRPPMYRAEATLLIGSFIQAPNPDVSEIRTGIELAQTYVELVQSYDVLQGTVAALDLPIPPQDLLKFIDVSVIRGTSLLRLVATYSDPVIAADIANTIAAEVIKNSPTNLTPGQQSQIAFLNNQIETLAAQVEAARQQLADLSKQIETSSDQAEIDALTARYTTVIDQVNQATATIAQFSSTIASMQQRTNSVDLVNRARIPTEPSGTGVGTITAFGAIIGAALAVGGVLLLEYFNDNLRTSEEVAQTLALPVLASIPRFGSPADTHENRLITQPDVPTSVAEGYRKLRTNLLFAAGQGRKGVYVITSPGPSEGKTVTTCNLGVALAMAGLRVLLLDADLRRPKVHEVFGLDNTIGLTSLLLAEPSHTQTAGVNGGDALAAVSFRECLQDTDVPGLRVITSGFIPANPTEILGSMLIQRWVRTFLESSNVDIVLIDTPPCLVVADSMTIATSARADVILVVDARRTRRSQALRAKDQFIRIDRDIKGVVLNGVDLRDEYYGYTYYDYYYTPADQRPKPAGWRRVFGAREKR